MLLEEGVCYDHCVLLAKLISLCPTSFCTPKPTLPVTSGISWLPTFAFQSPYMKRTSSSSTFIYFFFGGGAVSRGNVSSRKSCRSSKNHSNFFGINGRAIYLDYHDVEWFALETNGDHSVVYETAPKHSILNSLVDYEG